jgi:hypothetical protein
MTSDVSEELIVAIVLKKASSIIPETIKCVARNLKSNRKTVSIFCHNVLLKRQVSSNRRLCYQKPSTTINITVKTSILY